MKIYKSYYDSPIGIIQICGTEEGITSILFVDSKEEAYECPDCIKNCVDQLDEYFNGKRKEFDIRLLAEGTGFQKNVWNELTNVSYGMTASYKDIARAIGNEKAVRAVGSTNGKNPICIVVPCHRIIGSNGKLTGYAGGLWRKEWLLKHEAKYK